MDNYLSFNIHSNAYSKIWPWAVKLSDELSYLFGWCRRHFFLDWRTAQNKLIWENFGCLRKENWVCNWYEDNNWCVCLFHKGGTRICPIGGEAGIPMEGGATAQSPDKSDWLGEERKKTFAQCPYILEVPRCMLSGFWKNLKCGIA